MSAITTMLDLMNENARLRDLLRQSEEEITRLKEKAAERRENCIAYYDEQLAELRTQLAAMTAERDVLRQALTRKSMMEYAVGADAAWEVAKANEKDNIALCQQLAASLARCAQLEGALREAANSLRTMRTRTMQIDTADAIVRLLTTTERPPLDEIEAPNPHPGKFQANDDLPGNY